VAWILNVVVLGRAECAGDSLQCCSLQERLRGSLEQCQHLIGMVGAWVFRSNNPELAMNHVKSQHHLQHPMTGSEPVHFDFTHPTARTVCVAGSFNDWNTQSHPMHALGGGRWRQDCSLPSGVYEYRLVVDGVWTNDPGAHETVANQFGGRNAVLKVARAAGAQAYGNTLKIAQTTTAI